MSSRNPFVDDIAKVAASAFSTIGGLRDEAEAAMKGRLEALLADMDMVTREEFEAVRAMALKARDENDRLMEEIDALKAKLKTAPQPATRKAAPRKPAAKKAAATKTAAKSATKSAATSTARKTTAKRATAKKTGPKDNR